MQTSGVVGAGALGLGAATADPDAEHYVVVSDTHLGSPYANDESFEAFLFEELPALDPDALIIAGDFVEMWFRGMSSALVEFSRFTSQLEQFETDGIDVTLVSGNHDSRFKTIGKGTNDGIAPGSPWEFADEFFFESGDREFVAVHGDDADPIHYDIVSNLLCKGTDAFGSLLLNLLGWWEGLEPWAQAGEVGTTTVTGDSGTVRLGAAYSDPVVVTSGGRVNASVESVAGTDTSTLRLDGSGPVTYAVFERGRHVLGGSTPVEARRTTAGEGWQTVSFTEPFDAPPVVFTSAGSGSRGRVRPTDVRAGPTPDSVQVRNVTELGFDVRLDGAARTVGFAAVGSGGLTVRGQRGEVGVSSVGTAGTIGFDRTFLDRPAVLAAPQTAGPSLATEGIDTGGVSVTSTGPTEVGYLALEGGGPLYTADSTTIDTPDLEARYRAAWQSLVDDADLNDVAPAQPPAMAGVEPIATSQESVKEILLDSYDEFVVAGHTHLPGVDERYANSGCWTGRSPDSIVENTYLEIIDGEVTLNEFSAGSSNVLIG